MLNLFKTGKLKISSISIPDFGWTKEKETTSIIQWINPDQAMALSLNFFDAKPDIPTVKKIDDLRSFYRNNITQVNGGLINVDLIKINGIDAIKTIFKIPQQPSGMTYLASCTIPFARYSYVLKIQAPEMGITGFRDTAIFNRLLKEKVITSKEDGWFSDPYDTGFKEGTLMNKAEEEQYDTQFPQHPLTMARLCIDQVIKGVKFNESVDKVRQFNK